MNASRMREIMSGFVIFNLKNSYLFLSTKAGIFIEKALGVPFLSVSFGDLRIELL
jgi:hypothetical protein